jgi:hypothetical protein
MSKPERLSQKQLQAVVAVLTEPTLSKAAAKVGIGASTLRSWWKLPVFQDAIRAAGKRLVERSVARLQRISGAAVQTLARNLKCGKAGDEIRAALGILDHAVKGLELLEMAGQVEHLKGVLATLLEQNNTESTNGNES